MLEKKEEEKKQNPRRRSKLVVGCTTAAVITLFGGIHGCNTIDSQSIPDDMARHWGSAQAWGLLSDKEVRGRKRDYLRTKRRKAFKRGAGNGLLIGTGLGVIGAKIVGSDIFRRNQQNAQQQTTAGPNPAPKSGGTYGVDQVFTDGTHVGAGYAGATTITNEADKEI